VVSVGGRKQIESPPWNYQRRYEVGGEPPRIDAGQVGGGVKGRDVQLSIVSLAKRVRAAKRERRRRWRSEGASTLYYEALVVEIELANALEIATRIYEGHDGYREEHPLVVASPKIRMQR